MAAESVELPQPNSAVFYDQYDVDVAFLAGGRSVTFDGVVSGWMPKAPVQCLAGIAATRPRKISDCDAVPVRVLTRVKPLGTLTLD